MNNQVFDLEERTAKFAERLIDLLRKLPRNPINSPLIEQCTRSGGSIAANYCEANEAESRADFIHKIGISKKETKETKLWLRLLAKSNGEFLKDFRDLWKEANEFLLIFSKTIQTARKNSLK